MRGGGVTIKDQSRSLLNRATMTVASIVAADSPVAWKRIATFLDKYKTAVPLEDVHVEMVVRHATAACAVYRARALAHCGRVAAADALLRRAPNLAATIDEEVDLTVEACRYHSEFRQLIDGADRARDGRLWAEAEWSYFRALQLFPQHYGYRVQYGHALKEQNKWADAELQYRSALAGGAPLRDVEEHLLFVCQRQNRPAEVKERPASPANWLQRAPTLYLIDTLANLFWRVDALSVADYLVLMRSCPTCEDVAVALVEDHRFTQANRSFLEVVRDRA
jgi:hypothetical protein